MIILSEGDARMKPTPKCQKSVLVVCALVLLSTSAVHGQEQANQRETALRTHLRLPDSAVIRIPVQQTLPAANPMKVALAFGIDVEVFRNFVKWVNDDWNKKGDAKKYGVIQLIDEVADADVVLARFLQRDRSAGAATSASAYATTRGAAGDANTGDLVPLHAFILKKTDKGYDILGGYESTTTVDGSGGTGRNLWDEFKRLMKTRVLK